MMTSPVAAYRLAYDPGAHAAVLSRVDRGDRRIVKTWLLPLDLWASGDRERVDLRFDPRPRDGDVSEIKLFVRREFVGVAVDVHPRRTGRTLRAVFDAGPAALELAIASSAGTHDVPARIAAGTDQRHQASGPL